MSTETVPGKLHLLRGFVQWQDRAGKPIKTIDEAAEWVEHIASLGFDRFYTWTTRKPRRAPQLEGDSVYFVGGERRAQALFRMPFVTVEGEGDGKFAIMMRPKLIRVERRFVGRVRGWRYLAAEDAPPDLPQRDPAGDVPADLARALDEMGVG